MPHGWPTRRPARILAQLCAPRLTNNSDASISLLPVLPLPIGLPLLFCIYGLGGLTGWGILACMLAILAGRAPQAVPLAISLNLTATNVGAALAALVGGFALDHFGASSIGLVGAIFPLMALGVAILNRKSPAKGRQQALGRGAWDPSDDIGGDHEQHRLRQAASALDKSVKLRAGHTTCERN